MEVDVRSSTATASSVSIRLSGLDTVIYTHARVPISLQDLLTDMA